MSEPPLQSLSELLVKYAQTHTPERLQLSVQKLRLEEKHPSMRPFRMAHYEELEAALRVVVAERTGSTLETDVYPWLVAAAAVSAISSAIQIWAAAGAPDGQLPELVRSAINQIQNGLPVPVRSDAVNAGRGS